MYSCHVTVIYQLGRHKPNMWFSIRKTSSGLSLLRATPIYTEVEWCFIPSCSLVFKTVRSVFTVCRFVPISASHSLFSNFRKPDKVSSSCACVSIVLIGLSVSLSQTSDGKNN